MPAICGQPPGCYGCPRRRAISSVRCGLFDEVAAIERQQPLPVPLGSVAVIDRPLRKRETVMGVGIDLDLTIGAVLLYALLHLLDDLRRRVNVGLGASEIELGFCLLAG